MKGNPSFFITYILSNWNLVTRQFPSVRVSSETTEVHEVSSFDGSSSFSRSHITGSLDIIVYTPHHMKSIKKHVYEIMIEHNMT